MRVFFAGAACIVALVVVLAAASSDEAEWIEVVPLADAGLLSVAPGKSGRVGLWAHGDTFENDALFFDEEDRRYAAWFAEHQQEVLRKKREDMNLKLRKKSSPKAAKSTRAEEDGGDTILRNGATSGDNGAITKAAITLRTTNRRRVLDSSTVLLEKKYKSLEVDVRGTFKRAQRALGIVNHTQSQVEMDVQRILQDHFSAATLRSQDLIASLLHDSPREGNLSKTDTNPGTDPEESLLSRSVSAAASLLRRSGLLASLPFPFPLDDAQMQLWDYELDALLVDAKNVDRQLERAELGLHETEKKLRAVALEKAADDDDDLDSTSSASSKKRVAIAQSQPSGDSRASERLLSYSQRRADLKRSVLDRLNAIKDVLALHRQHHFWVMRTAAGAATVEVAMLKDRRSELQNIMTRNDESTAQLRAEMKATTKEMKSVQASIQELENVLKYSDSMSRRVRQAVPLDAFATALEWNAKIRRGASQRRGDDVVSRAAERSWPLALLGVTQSEATNLLAIPLLVSVLASWFVQTLLRWARRALLAVLRQIDSKLARRIARLTPRSESEVRPFDALIFALTIARSLLRASLTVVMFVHLTTPVFAPILCVLLCEGVLLDRGARAPNGQLPNTLLFLATHVLEPVQRILVLLIVVVTIVVTTLFSDKAQNTKPALVAKRHLGKR